MDIRGKNILMLGGSGLVGIAIARKLLPLRPARLAIAALRQDEAEEGVDTLRREPEAEGGHQAPTSCCSAVRVSSSSLVSSRACFRKVCQAGRRAIARSISGLLPGW